MKDTDYICMLAPMKSKLKLKGNALILFALIHGYSKDGKTTCRSSVKRVLCWYIKRLSVLSMTHRMNPSGKNTMAITAIK